MIRRILPLAVIFACTSFAWIILGTTILARTYSPDVGKPEVARGRKLGNGTEASASGGKLSPRSSSRGGRRQGWDENGDGI